MKRGREDLGEFLKENQPKLQKLVEVVREDPQALVEVAKALLGEEAADVVAVGVELGTNLCKAANSFMAAVDKVRAPLPDFVVTGPETGNVCSVVAEGETHQE